MNPCKTKVVDSIIQSGSFIQREQYILREERCVSFRLIAAKI